MKLISTEVFETVIFNNCHKRLNRNVGIEVKAGDAGI